MSKKYNFGESITSSYEGELAQAYISAALLSGKTLSEGLIQIKENVKYKGVLKTLSSTGLITDHTKSTSNCLQFKTVLHIVIQTVLHIY